MFLSGQTQDCLFHISDWGKFLWKTFISRYICNSQVSTHASDICSRQIHPVLCNRQPDGIISFFSQSCLRTSSMLAMSSKCLLFPIFIYKVDNENCCVYNSNVAINVTILITNSLFLVFFNCIARVCLFRLRKEVLSSSTRGQYPPINYHGVPRLGPWAAHHAHSTHVALGLERWHYNKEVWIHLQWRPG